MSEMVERVARGMFEAAIKRNKERHGDEAFTWDNQDTEDRDLWRLDAAAAIAAMREPTDAMLTAAADWSGKLYGKPIGIDAARGCYYAMMQAAIDEALK